MTIDAGKIWEMRLTMAFHAKGSYIAADQQKFIGRPMWRMADMTPFELLCPMFKNPWTPLFGVAFETNIGVKFIDFSQACSCSTSMGGMTVRASQCSLDHRMFVRKIKLGFDIRMARKTEVGVLLSQEILSDFRCMNLMAVVTSDRTEPMNPSPELEKGLLFLMAFQTDIRTVFCAPLFI
jgi:hypothetical protein